jgi:glycosyltransferase involved in cell wall biosynthesis
VPGRLDVVVPVHDGERYVESFLATVRSNRADGIRYLLMDDGSSDATADLVASGSGDLPVQVVRSPVNRGVAATRNAALDLADARYVTFLDVDDWCAPGHVPAMLGHAERLGAAMVRTDHVRVDGLRRTPERAPWDRRDEVFDAVEGIGDAGGRALVDYPYLWAGVFDRTQIEPGLLRFDEELRTAADRPWFWRLHAAGVTCAVVDSPGYFYRRSAGSGSLTQAGADRLLDFLPAYHRVLDVALAGDDEARARRGLYGACRIVGFHIDRRERLDAGLQRRLFAGAARLLSRGPDDAFAAAVQQTHAVDRRLLHALRDVGKAAAA